MTSFPMLSLHTGILIATCLVPAACRSREQPPAPPAGEVARETAAADVFMVLPGDYNESISVADLEARFGAANVKREGGEEPRVVLFPDDPTRRAYVSFYEQEKYEHLARIMVTDPDSRWRGKHGVHVGMSVAKLRELNGKPFYYSGFDQQRRGSVHDGWSPALEDDEKQPLGNFDVSEGDRLYFDLELGVADPSKVTSPGDLPVDEHLSSDDPRFPRFRELVTVTAISASSSLDDEWN
ncbi:MAG: hypothetical protein EOP88_15325 [Verrucomicrobiaceae bacterium]|nr:MAG: hypothetical protein EOP88_15325 [Verrucomicrobiaceae bacterium]